MIFEELRNFESLRLLAPGDMEKLGKVLFSLNADTPAGKIEVDGKRIYVSVSEYTTRKVADAKLEAHRKYVDIQLLLAGREYIGYSPLRGLPVTEAYNAEKDCGFYAFDPSGRTMLEMTPGVFAVFFPEEGHMPCLAAGEPSLVKKVVVKILADFAHR